MYKAILFDLDGTLTDSGEGITKSVQYALEKVGKPEPDLQKLRIQACHCIFQTREFCEGCCGIFPY